MRRVACILSIVLLILGVGVQSFKRVQVESATSTPTDDLSTIQEAIGTRALAFDVQPVAAPLAVDWWPMFHHDRNHTGYSTSTAPNTNHTIWNYTTGEAVISSPAVVDGKVYVGSCDKKIYCLDASTGAHIWNYTAGNWVRSSPAVVDGKVYVGSRDGKVYCLDASTGTYLWNYTTGDEVFSSPAVVDGKVYVGSRDGKVYCLDASTGAHVWIYTTGDEVWSSPAVAGDKVYVGSYDDKIYCLDASTGTHMWNYTTGHDAGSSPAVVDGKVYVGSDDGKVYCLDASTGAHVWIYTTGDEVFSSPAVADGKLYVGSDDGKVYVFGETRPLVVPDQYSTIQEAINNAADWDTVFVKAGIYYENVVVNKTISLVGEDSGTSIIDGNGTGHVLDVARDNVNITNFTVRKGGNATFPNFEAGISLNRVRDCRIAGNNIVDNGCAGIHLLDSDQNTISGNNLTRNIWCAIDLTTSSNNIISSNTAVRNPNIGIDLHDIGIGLHASSQNNVILANTIINCTYGIDAARSGNNTISGNYLANISLTGIWVQDYAVNNAICGNNVGDGRDGIKIEGQADGNIVSGNTVTSCQFGIQVLNARYTEISNNMIAHNYGSGWDAGLILDSAGYTLIHDNEITDNWRGIQLTYSSPNVSICGNNVTGNEFGIRVYGGGSSFLNVSGNLVVNNRGYGVGVTGIGGESNYAFISRNVIVNNIDGIALGQGSSYNTVVQNNISGNEYGIGMQDSTQNSICNNNIVNNTHQVSITSGSINAWKGSYAIGGNYWSDYNGLDQHSGPYQNLTGSDGIGDTPLILDGNNSDRYPLMMPWNATSRLVGDVNGDGKVDMKDIGYVARRFMCVPGDLLWDPVADLNNDGIVNMTDIGTVARHFGESLLARIGSCLKMSIWACLFIRTLLL